MTVRRLILALPALAALAFAAPALASAPLAAQPQQLSLEHKLLLRCSAAFALVAHGQETNNAAALAYPALGERGREYFVRASALVMDEAGLDREGIAAALSAEAQDMVDRGTLDAVMQVCLPMLPEG